MSISVGTGKSTINSDRFGVSPDAENRDDPP